MKITISKPCHEDWDAMTPHEKGRFCSVCTKPVQDFRESSDDEIRKAFSGAPDGICGKFEKSQLNRKLKYSSFSLAKFAAAGLFMTVGGLVSVQAQQVKASDTLVVKDMAELVLTGPAFKTKSESSVTGSVTVVSKDQIGGNGNKATSVQYPITYPEYRDRGPAGIRIGPSIASMKKDQRPLLVLDGKITELKKLRKIDPQAVESISHLSDQAEIQKYGSRGKNGVIIIITKKKDKR